jgi:hypothetical protein
MKPSLLAMAGILMSSIFLGGCAMWFPKAPTGIYQTEIETAEWRERLAKDPTVVPYSHR